MGLIRDMLTLEFLIRIQFFPLYRESRAFSGSNLFDQKSVFASFVSKGKTREPVIKLCMVFHRCSGFFCRQQTLYYIV